ncbi:MAG: hypothetical protein IJ685_04345 [Selenomonadaceae bacterium]|nr:hypothetical protein [Selenomonadaceae bacterium]
MAAKAGYIDPSIVERVLQNWLQETFPQAVGELQAEAQAQAEMQAEMPPEMQAQMQDGQSPEDLDRMKVLAQMFNGQAQPQQQSRPRTQAATESLMRGMTPAM